MGDRAARLKTLVDDLAREADALDVLLTSLTDQDWAKPTPAQGWDIRDSVAHIAIGDELALECVNENRSPQTMREGIEAVLEGEAAAHAFERKMLSRGRQKSPENVHRWWRNGDDALCKALASVDPDVRLPWGPNRMSPPSFTTARLMETWAHGLDCFDAADVTPTDTDRLRHIAELSVRALPYAFMINGLDSPGPVRVVLTSPSGEQWCIGPAEPKTVIRGTASDWCRVAVHRDRRDERSRLEGEGPNAADVIRYVQAYL